MMTNFEKYRTEDERVSFSFSDVELPLFRILLRSDVVDMVVTRVDSTVGIIEENKEER